MGFSARIQVGGWVGLAQFILPHGFDGSGINKAAGRIFGVAPEWAQRLGGAVRNTVPHLDDNTVN